MAITVNIYYRGKNGKAIEFANEMISSCIVNQIRNECVNIRCEYFLTIGNSETVLLIDSWKDQRALDNHHKSPLMAKIAALREKYDLHMTVERYVSDETELPDSDKAFIRK